MKALKIFVNVIIGIILFGLVFSLVFIRETNKIISFDVVKNTIEDVVKDLKDGTNELTKTQKDAIDSVFKDEQINDIISTIFTNYKEYRNNENFSISEEDYNKIYEFLLKYKDDFHDSEINNMTIEEFKEHYNYDKISELADKTFTNLDKAIDSRTLDRVLDGYKIATSYYVRLTIIFAIVLFIALLCLINWSLITWMVVFGFSLIGSGLLFSLLYNATQLVKEVLLNENINIPINLSPFMFVGIVQIVLGVILIAIYCILKTKIDINLNRNMNQEDNT